MIKEITMYAAYCDNCGKRWTDESNGYMAFTDEYSMRQNVTDDEEWYTEHEKGQLNKHYCPSCFSFDNDDNLVIAAKPNL